MNIRDVFAAVKVVPVLTVGAADETVEVARALAAGGLNVLEITLRSRTALGAIDAITRALPEVTVGVGTVTRAEEFRSAIDAGARFAVSPGLAETLVRAAREADVPYLPGVMTPSELIAARALGFTALKFFPAKPAGGVAALKALAPVFADVAFCPTGGVSGGDYLSYLALGNVFAVGGSWMAPADLVKARDWRAIETLARQISAGVRA